MTRIPRLTPLVLALSVLFAPLAHAHEGKTIGGFKTPESVLQTKDGRVFVSEIGEFGKDGDGQISVISPDGKVSVFATGMDDPKGLAIIGQDIYVTDKTRVLKVKPDGKWEVFTPTNGFPVTPQFLNDIEPDPKGNLYVSDSGDINTGSGGAIYRLDKAGKVTLVIDGKQDPKVLSPNGLVVDDTGDVLLEVDFASGILYSYNMKSKKLTKLAEGFGGGDGLVHASSGVIYVSDWKNGKVFELDHDDEVKLLKDGFKASADIALSKDEKYLIVPDMKAGEVVWLPLHPKKH